jgi:hypothetical protein
MTKPLTGVDFGKLAEAFRVVLPPIQKAFAAFHEAVEAGMANADRYDALTYSLDASQDGICDTGFLRATEVTTFSLNCRCFSPADTLSPADIAEVHSFLAFEFGLSVATSDRPKACQGCQNYYGETYNGNRLICGIYPYGWNDGDECPDRAEVN